MISNVGSAQFCSTKSGKERLFTLVSKFPIGLSYYNSERYTLDDRIININFGILTWISTV